MLFAHCRSNISTCFRRIRSFTRLPSYYPVVPDGKVSAAMFCKQFLAYAVHIDWCYHSIINIQVGLNMHLYDDIGDVSLSH